MSDVSRSGNLTKITSLRRIRHDAWVNRLIRTFLAGIVMGALGAGALAWYMPAVDLHRERSLVTVLPNGGNVEEFHINLPRDRILVGLPDAGQSIPSGLEWPGRERLGEMQAEIFKIRDANDAVVGVASRLASATETTGSFIEWSLHLPARGTIYVDMEVMPSEDGFRNGIMVSGTRDFATLSGSMRERFIDGGDEEAGLQGRISLLTALVGPLGDAE